MSRDVRSFRSVLGALAALMMLGACQTGLEASGGVERAQPAEVPPGMPPSVDAGACWAQAHLPRGDGTSEERLFAVPCPAALTPAFWASVQRALSVRGLYTGPVNGVPDVTTSDAVRRYQADLGLDSPVLSLHAARRMGLMPWPQP